MYLAQAVDKDVGTKSVAQWNLIFLPVAIDQDGLIDLNTLDGPNNKVTIGPPIGPILAVYWDLVCLVPAISKGNLIVLSVLTK